MTKHQLFAKTVNCTNRNRGLQAQWNFTTKMYLENPGEIMQ